MRPKIAVLCAPLPERNTGMVTVDLAAHCYFRRFQAQADARMYTFGPPPHPAYRDDELPFTHRDISHCAEDYLSSDLFVFWGDFIHARSYQQTALGRWNPALRAALDAAQAMAALHERFARYAFLSDLPDAVLRRSVLFGGTIITNSAADDLDRRYRAQSERLFAGLGGAFFRDAMSAAKVAPLRDGDAALGCDCAFLLDDRDLAALPGFHMAASRSRVGVFFGRSGLKPAMMLFSRLVGRLLDEECRWLPWFPSRRRVRWAARAFGHDVPSEPLAPGALLGLLSGFRYVVTDTYHVCVNAWRLGIPTVCIGTGAMPSVHSLADKKKEVLFEMYGARPFYVYLESLTGPAGFRRAAHDAARALADRALADRVRETIADHRAMSGRALDASLRRSLHDLHSPTLAPTLALDATGG